MKATDLSHSPLIPATNWLQSGRTQEVSGFAWYLLVATLLAALVRLYNLDGQSLWVDEILTWRQIRPDAGLEFWPQIRDSIQGPLYQALLWPLLREHAGAFWLRLPAALAGIFSVPLLGVVGAKFFGQRTGLLAALLLAINPFHVWYSQEARGYAFMILFTILAGYLFLNLAQGRGRLGQALWLALVGALAMLGNLAGSFFWFALGLTWLLFVAREKEQGRLWIWLLSFGLGTALVGPWLLRASGIWAVGRVLPGADMGGALRGASTFSPLAVPYTFFSFCFGFSFGPSLADLHLLQGHQVLGTFWPYLFAGGLAVIIPLLWILRSLRGQRWFLVVWVAVPLVVLLLLAVRNVKPWNPRYVATALPWLLVLVAAGLVRLPGKFKFGTAGLLVGLTLFALGNYYWAPRYAKADLRSAAAFLTKENVAGEPIVVPVVTEVLSYYYHGPGALIDSHHVTPLDGSEAAHQFMADRLSGTPAVWLVLAREWDFDSAGYFLAELSRTGTLLQVFKAAGVRVFHWQRHGAEPK